MTSDRDDGAAATPLPGHVEATVQTIAELHAEHERRASHTQRWLDRLTARAGSPRFLGAMTLVSLVWLLINLAMERAGVPPFDAPPFPWLNDAATLIALLATLLILTTQRRADELATRRDQLTLQLAIVNEQKSAKIIALLEELRRDDPRVRDRADAEAEEMSHPADAKSVLDAIRSTSDVGPSAAG